MLPKVPGLVRKLGKQAPSTDQFRAAAEPPRASRCFLAPDALPHALQQIARTCKALPPRRSLNTLRLRILRPRAIQLLRDILLPFIVDLEAESLRASP